MIYITNANARINILSITASCIWNRPNRPFCCSQFIGECYNAPNSQDPQSAGVEGGIWAVYYQENH